MDLHVEKLHAERGGRPVLAGIDFHARAGELIILNGPNGSGKTTLLRIIAGSLDAQSGGVRIEGGDPNLSIAQQVHFAGHLDALKLALTVEENLRFWVGILGGRSIDEGLAAFELAGLRDFPAAILSAGQRRRLALSRLRLVYRPLWLLDEPAVSLDSASCRKLATYMQQHLARGGLIVAATHGDLGVAANRTITLGHSG